jgi:hypothetical protein
VSQGEATFRSSSHHIGMLLQNVPYRCDDENSDPGGRGTRNPSINATQLRPFKSNLSNGSSEVFLLIRLHPLMTELISAFGISITSIGYQSFDLKFLSSIRLFAKGKRTHIYVSHHAPRTRDRLHEAGCLVGISSLSLLLVSISLESCCSFRMISEIEKEVTLFVLDQPSRHWL